MWNGLKYFKLPDNKYTLYGLAFTAILSTTIILFSPYIPYSLALKEGDTSKRTIVSPRFIQFESNLSSLEHRVSTPKERIFTLDESVNKAVLDNIELIFEQLHTLHSSVQSNGEITLPDDLKFLNFYKEQLSKYSSTELNTLEYFTVKTAQAMLEHGVNSTSSQNIYSLFNDSISHQALQPLQEGILLSVITHVIKPNLVYSTENSTSKSSKRLSRMVTLREGEPIIYKGDTVTKMHIELFQALNIYQNKANLLKFMGILFIVTLLFILVERFVYYFHPQLYPEIKYFVLMFVLFFMVISFARWFQTMDWFPNTLNLSFLIPVSLASMVLSMLLTPHLALLCGTITSVAVAIIYKMDTSLLIYLFLSNSVTVFASYQKYKRAEYIMAGYLLGLFNVVLVLSIGLIQEVHQLKWFLVNIIMGLLNGVLSAMISLAILPYFESIFSITTKQTLLELSNLNHPLLKRLMVTAPGTYQHSLMVATLAEAAAEDIQADAILARVGAYFHDIGKMKRPGFFTENQHGGENPHTSLTPRMSALIISAHVKDGLELASKYKLPHIIQDFIHEHHGTSLVSFFYSQALHTEDIREEDAEFLKEEFRYPGPKPHFKESGIVMLADGIEAASRSMEKPTMQKLEALIDRMIQEKINDNQLDECPLTLQEIEMIKQAFLQVFKGIYHVRIDYQDELEAILEK